jgi:hypothetical protein
MWQPTCADPQPRCAGGPRCLTRQCARPSCRPPCPGNSCGHCCLAASHPAGHATRQIRMTMMISMVWKKVSSNYQYHDDDDHFSQQGLWTQAARTIYMIVAPVRWIKLNNGMSRHMTSAKGSGMTQTHPTLRRSPPTCTQALSG